TVTADAQALEVRWDPDMPVRRADPAAARALRRQDRIAPEIDEWREPAAIYGEPETVEPAQPIQANLIEFPRELVATRKARPRIAEGPLVPEGGQSGQLSIFEVDLGAISIQPEPADSAMERASSGWSRIRLDPEPEPQPEPMSATESAAVCATPLRPAPFGLRAMAALVDGGLIGALFVAAALVATEYVSTPPSMKSMELTAVLALFVIGALYQAFFFTLAQSTPGMRYAGLRLSTFDDEMPTRAQLRRRLCALILSLLPVGLGLVWAIFDEDHLSWHDRISKTYQR
ncbi:MAG: RDD family protein, partial [Terracidiphilus sp.]